MSPVGQHPRPTPLGEKGPWGASQIHSKQSQGPASPWATRISLGYQHLLSVHRTEAVTGTRSPRLTLPPEDSPQPARWLTAGLHLYTQDRWNSSTHPHAEHRLSPSPP